MKLHPQACPKRLNSPPKKEFKNPTSHLHVENALRLESGVMKVKVLAPFLEWNLESGMIEESGYLASELLPRLTGLEQRLR